MELKVAPAGWVLYSAKTPLGYLEVNDLPVRKRQTFRSGQWRPVHDKKDLDFLVERFDKNKNVTIVESSSKTPPKKPRKQKQKEERQDEEKRDKKGFVDKLKGG